MPRQVFSVAELEELLASGAQLVDVLGAKEFARDHIRGPSTFP